MNLETWNELQVYAACRPEFNDGRDVGHLFFAEHPVTKLPVGHAKAPAMYREAKQICARCPIEPECLAYHLVNERAADRFGVAGGKTADERSVLAGERNPTCVVCGDPLTSTRRSYCPPCRSTRLAETSNGGGPQTCPGCGLATKNLRGLTLHLRKNPDHQVPTDVEASA